MQEGIDGIHAVDGGIPGLGALRLEEPTLHLCDRLRIIRCQTLHRLDGDGLGGDLIVEPRITGTWGVVVTTHILAIHGVFLQRLHILGSKFRFGLREDDRRQGLLIERLVLDLLLQQGHQIGVGLLYISRQLPSVEGGEVEPLQGLEAGEGGLMTFLRPFLHFLHLVDDLTTHELKGGIEHLGGLTLLTRHLIQTHEHLTDADGHIERAWHLGPPAPSTVGTLEFTQLIERLLQAVLHQVLIEEVAHTLFLFGLVVGIEHPWCLIEQEILQFLVLLQCARQRVGIRLLFPELEGALGLWVLFEDMTTEAISIIGSRQGDGVIIIGGTYDRECLGHQPGRLVGIFHREFRLGGISRHEFRQIDRGDTRMMLGDGYGDRDM